MNMMIQYDNDNNNNNNTNKSHNNNDDDMMNERKGDNDSTSNKINEEGTTAILKNLGLSSYKNHELLLLSSSPSP